MARQQAELAGRDLGVRIGQPAGIGEDRFGEADVARALRHLGAEFGLVAGERLGQHDAGVVGRLDDEAVQQVVDADAAVQRREHGRAVRRRAAFAPGVLADQVLVGQLDAALGDLVEHVFGRHQLGETGRKNQFVGVALEQHAAVLGVDQDGVRRRDLRLVLLAAEVLLGLRQRRHGQGHCQHGGQGRRREPARSGCPQNHRQRSRRRP